MWALSVPAELRTQKGQPWTVSTQRVPLRDPWPLTLTQKGSRNPICRTAGGQECAGLPRGPCPGNRIQEAALAPDPPRILPGRAPSKAGRENSRCSGSHL
ncbi:Hypothetical predicted protein [Marmota monax]|uniref:Uncharacterized protein n=1 Tax=Marmota monax TaxID=9995 RepID=A0A5E4BN40_MARMO|nr:hypothetical protein GHT09_019780 [Marmota monax]VTJ70401.1 Hypothetical predicted protein [Marmota monax]